MARPRFKSQSEHRRSYGATDGVDREADPADGALSPHRIEPATVLVDIKAWPGNVSVFGKIGATASLDIHCASASEQSGPGRRNGLCGRTKKLTTPISRLTTI